MQEKFLHQVILQQRMGKTEGGWSGDGGTADTGASKRQESLGTTVGASGGAADSTRATSPEVKMFAAQQ